MSQADKIAYSQYVGPHLQVEVDEWGQIQVAVQSGSTRLDSRVDTDGWVRADISNADALAEALYQARAFARAVWPNGKAVPTNSGWRERRDAYLALASEHKLSSRDGAGDITAFLTDYASIADDPTRPGMTMAEFAKEWERWW